MAYTSNPHMPRVRMKTVLLVRSGWSIRKAARYVGVEPSTVMRWIKKAPSHGNNVIPTLSSRPNHHPNELSDEVVEKILEYRRKHRRCAEVLQYILKKDGIEVSLSSVKRILKRRNLVYPSKWKKWHKYPVRPIAESPGILVEIDSIHIGEPTDRIYVYSLIDVFSRWAYAFPSLRINTHRSLKFVKSAQDISPFQFQTLQSDHGSEFSKWFTKRINEYGLAHRHSRVRTPSDNGHLERFNRTIQEECLKRIPRNLKSYQKEIPEYLIYYNKERPHMALDMKSPLEVLRSY